MCAEYLAEWSWTHPTTRAIRSLSVTATYSIAVFRVWGI